MYLLILTFAILGFAIALYDYIVEKKLKENPAYKPACDLSDRVSCSAVIKSPYSRIFFLSNAVIGIAYYILVAMLASLEMPFLLYIATIGGVLVSIVLAYLLYFKIKSLCIVCTSLYAINLILLLLSIKEYYR
jgi:uncharacterized membrane protein